VALDPIGILSNQKDNKTPHVDYQLIKNKNTQNMNKKSDILFPKMRHQKG
jgi:hypothetical protein